jgi:hypothetical protein
VSQANHRFRCWDAAAHLDPARLDISQSDNAFRGPAGVARTLPEELQRLLGDSGFHNRKRGVTVPSYRTA